MNVKIVAKQRFLLQTSLLTNQPVYSVDDEGDFVIFSYLSTSGPSTAPGSVGPISFSIEDRYGAEVVPAVPSSLGYQGGEGEGQSTPIHAVAGSTVTVSIGGSAAPSGSTYDLFITIVKL